jgi:hypothetical protein
VITNDMLGAGPLAVVEEHLLEEFVPRLHRNDVTDAVDRAYADLRGSIVSEALPAMVERLVRRRLRDQSQIKKQQCHSLPRLDSILPVAGANMRRRRQS